MRKISIKAMRLRKKMTQVQLADAMGVHQTNIVAWEHGKWLPRAKRLADLAEILNCTVDDLLKKDDTT